MHLEAKDILLTGIALLGWAWAVVQFFLHRKYQKRDKILDRRYEAYAGYLKKSDELWRGVRQDPDMTYGISNDFMRIALEGDEEKTKAALLELNQKMYEFAKRATEPLLIIRQELNALELICSPALMEKITELKSLIEQYNTAMQQALGLFNVFNIQPYQEYVQEMSRNPMWRRFEELNREMLELMRKEIGAGK